MWGEACEQRETREPDGNAVDTGVGPVSPGCVTWAGLLSKIRKLQ